MGARHRIWLLAVLGGCRAENVVQPPPPNGVAVVSVRPTAVSAPVGQAVQVTAIPQDIAGNVLPGWVVTWTSSDTTVATVSTAGFTTNTSGFVTPVAPGTAMITATSGGKRGTTVISVAVPTAGQSYYVDAVAGNDTNSGTSAAPWQTIQHAADVLRPGDTAVVNDGVYTGPYNVVTIGRSGTPTAWLVFKSAHRWGAVIDGQSNTSTTGFEIDGAYIRVDGFEVRNTARYGIDAQRGHDVFVSQNHVHDIGRVCTDNSEGIVGVDAYDDNLVIERNVIHDIGRLGPGEQGCSPTNTYWQNHDHGVYHGVGDNVVIRNNIFYNLPHGWAIQRYDKAGGRTTGLTIVNNTFAGDNPWRPGQVIIASATTDLLIANNIFYLPNTAGVWFDATALMNVTVSTNLTMGGPVSTGTAESATFAGNLDDTDPKFANPVGFDFHVQSGSAAIGAGLRLAIVPDDVDGLRRATVGGYTVGAYQYP